MVQTVEVHGYRLYRHRESTDCRCTVVQIAGTLVQTVRYRGGETCRGKGVQTSRGTGVQTVNVQVYRRYEVQWYIP